MGELSSRQARFTVLPSPAASSATLGCAPDTVEVADRAVEPEVGVGVADGLGVGLLDVVVVDSCEETKAFASILVLF